MNAKSPQEPTEPTDGTSDQPTEINLRDGESVSLSTPTDGTANIVINVVPPERSSGFFGSCLQGCGCLVILLVFFSAIGAFSR